MHTHIRALALSAFVMPCTVSAQFTLQGQIRDTARKPVPLADLRLWSGDHLQGSTLTDSTGSFSFSGLRPGSYQLIMGDKDGTSQFYTVVLRKDTFLNLQSGLQYNELSAVEVSTKQPILQQGPDRLIYNNEQIVTGGDALTVLQSIPGILVQNGQVTIAGRSGLSIMIENQPLPLSGESLINFLRTIPADDIKQMELITAPAARYDAEGAGGLINIRYKKGRKNDWNNSIRSSYTQTSYGAYALGNTFTYHKGKLSLSAAGDVRKGHSGGEAFTEIHYPDQKWTGKNKNKYRKDNYSERINIDYQLRPGTSIGSFLIMNQSNPDISSDLCYTISRLDQGKERANTIGKTSEQERNSALNIHLQHALDTAGRQLSADLDYFTYTDRMSRSFNTCQQRQSGTVLQELSAENCGSLSICNMSAKVDMVYPTRWATVSLGAKAAITRTNSDINFYNRTSGTSVLDSVQTNKFRYHENIQAIYISFSKSARNLQFTLGARQEFTQTKGRSPKTGTEHELRYARFFPNVNFRYQIGKQNAIQLNYNKRISRPAYWELNPFRWYSHANAYAEGNPLLQAAFIDNAELSHSLKDQLITAVSVSFRSNAFSRVSMIDRTEFMQIAQRKNHFDFLVLGISETYHFRKLRFLASSIQVKGLHSKEFEYSQYRSYISPANTYSYYLSSANTILFNKKGTVTGSINFNYGSACELHSEYSSLDAGIQFSLLDKQLQIAANVYDILKKSNPTTITSASGVRQVFNNYNDNRFARISLIYNLGNRKIQAVDRKSGNQDEKERSKSLLIN